MMSLFIDVKLDRKEFMLSFKAEMSAGITGLFGPSGSGKTTLLHCIAGLVRPDAGRIELNGNILFDKNLHVNMPSRKRRMGFVFQEHLLFPHLTVAGNLKYGQKITAKERKKQLCDIAELLEIGHLLNRNVKQLSGGEKQRVALGRAILSSPKLLLLDEPFTGLDQVLKRQLIHYMKKLYEKTHIPMILVSHNPEEMAHLADELCFIENGKLYAQAKLNKTGNRKSIGRFCSSNNPNNFQKTKNLLVGNHGLQFNCNGRAKVS